MVKGVGWGEGCRGGVALIHIEDSNTATPWLYDSCDLQQQRFSLVTRAPANAALCL